MDHRQTKLSTAMVVAGFIIWMLISPSYRPVLTVAAIVLHEIGHIVGATLAKVPLGGFRLIPCEARLSLENGLISYPKEAFIGVAGPLCNLLCVGACHWFGAKLFDTGAVSFFSTVSAALAILNLLPIADFDGGRLLRCLLIPLVGLRASDRICEACSLLTLFCLWCLSVYIVFRVGTNLSLFLFSISLFIKILSQGTAR